MVSTESLGFAPGFNASLTNFFRSKARQDESRNIQSKDPSKEAEVLVGIDPQYFTPSATFDSTRYELEVSKKISNLILENHPSYSAELKKVTELQVELHRARDLCLQCRKHTRIAQQRSTAPALKIVALNRKHRRLGDVLQSLKTIKTLEETDIRLRELLEEGNFPGAISLCLECQKVSLTFSQFNCIRELSVKLNSTLASAEEQLDAALAMTCLSFQSDQFPRLCLAFDLLGKAKWVAERLVTHFLSAVDTSAVNVMLEAVADRAPVIATASADASTLVDLSKLLRADEVLATFTEMCKIFWRILSNYQLIIKWYMDSAGLLTSADDAADTCDQTNFLIREQVVVWQRIEEKTAIVLDSSNCIHMKFDGFLCLLKTASCLMDVGRKCSSASTTTRLHDALVTACTTYFKQYHRSRLEELRMFLEAEVWEVCPVVPRFSIYDLHEFHFLKAKLPTEATVSFMTYEAADDVGVELHKDGLVGESENPFEDSRLGLTSSADPTRKYSDDVSDDEQQTSRRTTEEDESVASNRETRQTSLSQCSNLFRSGVAVAPILCNAGLNLLRLFGRYLQMATLMNSIAFDILLSLTQLFDYYFYSVYHFYGRPDMELPGVSVFSSRLTLALRRIESQHFISQGAQLVAPGLNSMVNLQFADQLYGLSEKVVAVESLTYISQQLEVLRPFLEKIIPTSKVSFLKQYFAHTVAAVADIRRPVYGSVAFKAVSLSRLQNSIIATSWDICDLMSQHSAYIDFLVQDLHNFQLRLGAVSTKVHIPRECHCIVWELCILAIFNILVEGAKRCTSEGRALMQLDFQQLLTKLEQITDIRPIPGKDFVDNYIKAYYQPESALESWIKEHSEYSSKQLANLLNVISHLSHRTRQRLLRNLEESASTRPAVLNSTT